MRIKAHYNVVTRAWKEKVICSVSICCYCFVSSIMSSSIHIKFLFHQKTNKSICMNFRGFNKIVGTLALQSSHHGPASNFGFNSLSLAKGKLPILVRIRQRNYVHKTQPSAYTLLLQIQDHSGLFSY